MPTCPQGGRGTAKLRLSPLPAIVSYVGDISECHQGYFQEKQVLLRAVGLVSLRLPLEQVYFQFSKCLFPHWLERETKEETHHLLFRSLTGDWCH